MKKSIILWTQGSLKFGSLMSQDGVRVEKYDKSYSKNYDAVCDVDDMTLIYNGKLGKCYQRGDVFVVKSYFSERDESNRRICFLSNITGVNSFGEVLSLVANESKYLGYTFLEDDKKEIFEDVRKQEEQKKKRRMIAICIFVIVLLFVLYVLS